MEIDIKLEREHKAAHDVEAHVKVSLRLAIYELKMANSLTQCGNTKICKRINFMESLLANYVPEVVK